LARVRLLLGGVALRCHLARRAHGDAGAEAAQSLALVALLALVIDFNGHLRRHAPRDGVVHQVYRCVQVGYEAVRVSQAACLGQQCFAWEGSSGRRGGDNTGRQRQQTCDVVDDERDAPEALVDDGEDVAQARQALRTVTQGRRSKTVRRVGTKAQQDWFGWLVTDRPGCSC